MTRKPITRPREMWLGTVREFERDQAVQTLQTLAKVRRGRVAQLAQTDTCAPRLRTSERKPFVESKQSLPSQLDAVSPFIDRLMRFVAMFRGGDGSEVDIEVALREAILNAVIHGNAEAPEKRVYVTCRCTSDGEVSITIRDEGQGFDIDAVPDPTTPENLLSTHGRGIHLMTVLMDQVSFEVGGTVVQMRKKPNAGTADSITDYYDPADEDSAPVNRL